MNIDFDYVFTSMFDEAQKKLDRKFRSSNNFRDHAKSVLITSSAMVPLFSAINLLNSPTLKTNSIYKNLIAWVIANYYVHAISSSAAIMPYFLTHGVKATPKYYKKSKNGILYMLILKYL